MLLESGNLNLNAPNIQMCPVSKID